MKEFTELEITLLHDKLLDVARRLDNTGSSKIVNGHFSTSYSDTIATVQHTLNIESKDDWYRRKFIEFHKMPNFKFDVEYKDETGRTFVIKRINNFKLGYLRCYFDDVKRSSVLDCKYIAESLKRNLK